MSESDDCRYREPLDREAFCRGGYLPARQWLGEQPTAAAIWGLASFLESASNARSAIRGEVVDPHQRSQFPWSVLQQTARAVGTKRDPLPTIDAANADAVDAAADLVSASVRHARAYFQAADTSPNTVKPNLLYYGCLSLAKAVVAATFRTRGVRTVHGLQMREGYIRVLTDGEFSYFHDALCTDPELYARGDRTFDLDQVLCRIPRVAEAIQRVQDIPDEIRSSTQWQRDGLLQTVRSREGWYHHTHLLALELMAVYALADLSRYDPVRWEMILRGHESGRTHVYLTLLSVVALDFPLVTANIIMDIDHYFGPRESDEEFKRRVERVLGQTLNWA